MNDRSRTQAIEGDRMHDRRDDPDRAGLYRAVVREALVFCIVGLLAIAMITTLTLPQFITDFEHHDKQRAYEDSQKRWNYAAAARRTGKSKIFLRRLNKFSMSQTQFPDAQYAITAPTRDQVKRLFWNDTKAMYPPEFITDTSETELRLQLFNGSVIWLFGMDKPERVEGISLSGGGSDEFGNMKDDAFDAHIRPALADRLGWWDFLGVPEGRNHYYRKWLDAQNPDAVASSDCHSWTFAEVAPIYMGQDAVDEELRDAMRTMDMLTFDQEYNGSFVTFEGRAYYAFNIEVHASKGLKYYPKYDLDFAFDFNVSPAVCSISQEVGDTTRVIGEVYIPKNGNTPAVCRRLLADWGDHKGDVFLYGDATGGNRHTSQIAGSDWDIVHEFLRPTFGDRMHDRVPNSNPPEHARVQAVNSRFESADHTVSMVIDPVRCPETVRCCDGVMLLKGGSGEIDKKHDKTLTHLSDSLGYKIVSLYPIGGRDEIEVYSLV
jgi:hypothetical protein